MRRALFSCLLLACGGPAAGPTTPDRAEACPEPEAPRVVVRRPTAPSLDGRWMVREVDDEDVELVIELSGGRGTARSARSDDHAFEIAVGESVDGLKRLQLSRAGGTERVELYWTFTGPDRALVFEPGDDDLAVAQRVGPVPADLQGRWVGEDPRGGDLVFFELGADRAEVREGDRAHEGTAAGLGVEGSGVEGSGVEGDRFELLIGMRRGSDERLTAIVLQRLTPELYLAWPAGDDDYALITWARRPRATRRRRAPGARRRRGSRGGTACG